MDGGCGARSVEWATTSRRTHRHPRWCLSRLAVIGPALALLAACRALTAPAPSATPRLASSVVSHEFAAATADTTVPTATAEPVTAPSSADLPSPGPYLVYPAIAVNTAAAGSGGGFGLPAAGITTDLIVRHPDGRPAARWRLPGGGTVRRMSDALSPDGRWLAFVSGDVPDWHLTKPITNPLRLRVWDLAAEREAFATPILRAEARDELRRLVAPEAGAVAWEAEARALSDSAAWGDTPLMWDAEDVTDAFDDGLGTVKWAPDGKSLAVIGALDGPSTDVYVLGVDDWRLRRVSDEPTHVTHMSWSPDGRWILHEGTDRAGRASGYVQPTTTDVSAADGSTRRHLWSGSRTPSSDAWPDAWLGEHDAVVHSVNMGCGVCDVVGIDASTGITRAIVPAMSALNFVVKPDLGVAAIAGSIGDLARNERHLGVTLVPLDGSAPAAVGDQRCRVARWEAENLPFVWLTTHVNDGCVQTAFGPGGRTLPLVEEPPPDLANASVSPGRRWRVLFGKDGWRLYDAGSREVGRHSAEEMGVIDAVSWRPAETGFFALVGENLWMVDLPNGTPRRVDDWSGWAPWWAGLDATWWSP